MVPVFHSAAEIKVSLTLHICTYFAKIILRQVDFFKSKRTSLISFFKLFPLVLALSCRKVDSHKMHFLLQLFITFIFATTWSTLYTEVEKDLIEYFMLTEGTLCSR